ncbi:MAG: methylmalonyl Co-A mutase-associated GTPase MeaB [Bacteroidetes bacterium]|nr:methylmalonyl Co-A mutase-associated GTPase MeaB [Bacteroidota bacterium]
MSHINPHIQALPEANLDEKVLQEGIVRGDRKALSQAITLVESKLPQHQERRSRLLDWAVSQGKTGYRLGITGVPGAGKSSLIETLGLLLVGQGHRVAVLAIDPSSRLRKGSILGDKTRMEKLSRHPQAFIRPSASGGHLGGVAAATREALVLCEAAGYDHILVETVGVGQSEIEVKDLVDFFLLVLVPLGGDELQGMKRGIVEMANLIVINKADGDHLQQAKAARLEYARALSLFPGDGAGWKPRAITASALLGSGVDEILEAMQAYRVQAESNGAWHENRREQAVRWMLQYVEQGLLSWFKGQPRYTDMLTVLKELVAKGQRDPFGAARELLGLLPAQS